MSRTSSGDMCDLGHTCSGDKHDPGRTCQVFLHDLGLIKRTDRRDLAQNGNFCATRIDKEYLDVQDALIQMVRAGHQGPQI